MATSNSKWDINISNIREYKYRSTEFWNYMKEVASCIKKDGPIYRDIHRNEPNQQRELDDLIFVCIILNEDGSMKFPEYYGYMHPTAWVFPGDRSPYLCKNPLYTKQGKLYLTVYSTGFDLYGADIAKLREGKLLVQEYRILCEENLRKELNMAIPVDDFVNLFFPSDTEVSDNDIVDKENEDNEEEIESDFEIFI